MFRPRNPFVPNQPFQPHFELHVVILFGLKINHQQCIVSLFRTKHLEEILRSPHPLFLSILDYHESWNIRIGFGVMSFWILQFDGAYKPSTKATGVGVKLTSPRGEVYCYSKSLPASTYNQAEYSALIFGLGKYKVKAWFHNINKL